MTFLNNRREADVTARAKLVEKNASTEKVEHLSVAEVEQTFAKVKDTCKTCLTNVKTCSSSIECSTAATALQVCMANIICQREAAAFKTALETGDDKQVNAAFDAMNDQLELFQERSARAMQQQAEREASKE